MQIIGNLFIITLSTLVLVFSWSSPAFSDGEVTVTTSSDGETIRIIGDDESNSIAIITDDSYDILVVTGHSTTVTGSPVGLNGVTKIIVTMKGGSDIVSIGGNESEGGEVDSPDCDWRVNGNAGHDSIGVSNFRARSLMVRGGGGNDFIFMFGLTGVTVEEQSGADGGSGNNDEFSLDDRDVRNWITGPFDLMRFEFIGTGCFRGDTLIDTETGLRPIRTIRVGERVWSWDESSGKKVLRKVSRTYRKPASGLRTLSVGQETLFTTDAHPFWVEGKGWIKASRLRVGDTLRSDDGARLAVLSNDRVDSQRFYTGYDITKDHGVLASVEQQGFLRLAAFQPSEPFRESHRIDGVVYNLEVEDTHTFFVGKQKVFVHNK